MLTLTLGTALPHLPSVQAAEELCRRIKQIESARKSSASSPGHLRGYAAQYQNRGMALYLTADGNVLGNM